MFKKSIVFIVGAGGSYPYGFPQGSTLVDEICRNSLEEQHGFDPSQYHVFVQELRKSRLKSVDAFLEKRQEFIEIGKKAIAFQLMAYERSNVQVQEHSKNDDWYSHILHRMTDTAKTLYDVPKNKVAFVTFNYDRSLEQYLFEALSGIYGQSASKVADVMNQIPFVHVHGRLGYLPWQTKDGGNQREYRGTINHPNELEIAAAGIKIIPENITDSEDFQEVHKLMKNAERIGFLGFGYHPTNMERLAYPQNRDIRGTALGYTQAQQEELKNKYRGLYLHSLTCTQLLTSEAYFVAD